MNKFKKFYKRKDLSRNSKEGKKYGALIIGLLFLCVVMLGLVVNRVRGKTADESYDGSNVVIENQGENKPVIREEESADAAKEAEKPESDIENSEKELDEIPGANELPSGLTRDEVEFIKNAIDNDYKEYIILVNKNHTLAGLYGSDNLTIPNVKLQKGRNTDESKVRADIAPDLESMFSAAEADGVDLYLNSGYRSYETQKIVYANEINQNGGVDTGYVAKPGTSEHQTGLAVDLTSSEVNMNLSEDFKDSKSGQWLFDNAYKYGFILRYDKSKEEVTGYKYEPWHYRYVGDKDLSKLCHDKNLTIEDLYNAVK